MDVIGPKWTKWTRYDPSGLNWTELDQIVQNGPDNEP